MAQQRTARLISAHHVGEHTRVMTFTSEEPIGFAGGQYIIVNTGIPLPGDKIAKRAYSLMSSDKDQRRFEIAVRRIDSGPGSNYMHNLPVGEELAFSGPWGKFLPSSDADSASTLIVATDTGITAAMGLVTSTAFQSFPLQATLFWLLESDEYFLPEAFVEERIAGHCESFEVIRIPSGDAERAHWLKSNQEGALRRMLLNRGSAAAFLSGDGFLLARFQDALREGESKIPSIRIESFFHHQELKTTVKAVAS